MAGEIKLFTGNANQPLAEEIAAYLRTEMGQAVISTFSDGEVQVMINENVRCMDIFIIQPTCAPVNDNLMELLLMIDAFKRASAKRITAVMPYYGYARQDRKTQPRVPISARLIADLLTAAKVDRILTIELHAGQIQGFFNIPVDNLYTIGVFLDYFKQTQTNDIVIVSPDAGGVERASKYAKKLGSSIAIIDKRRDAPNVSHAMNVVGDVNGLDAIIIDDLVDTAGTITQAASALKEKGARRVISACTHAVLSGPALERINNSVIDELVITNTIPMNSKLEQCSKLKVLSVASLLGEAIVRIHKGTSVSSLFL
ncbi:MAG TPA: ribose-phosphate pyrophosphokinase [Thermodesulfovibrionia bacterium]|nr:ribose-phosphate pyrophosphokinase [Thermodesulfovibrionia bacterium]